MWPTRTPNSALVDLEDENRRKPTKTRRRGLSLSPGILYGEPGSGDAWETSETSAAWSKSTGWFRYVPVHKASRRFGEAHAEDMPFESFWDHYRHTAAIMSHVVSPKWTSQERFVCHNFSETMVGSFLQSLMLLKRKQYQYEARLGDAKGGISFGHEQTTGLPWFFQHAPHPLFSLQSTNPPANGSYMWTSSVSGTPMSSSSDGLDSRVCLAVGYHPNRFESRSSNSHSNTFHGQ